MSSSQSKPLSPYSDPHFPILRISLSAELVVWQDHCAAAPNVLGFATRATTASSRRPPPPLTVTAGRSASAKPWSLGTRPLATSSSTSWFRKRIWSPILIAGEGFALYIVGLVFEEIMFLSLIKFILIALIIKTGLKSAVADRSLVFPTIHISDAKIC